MHRTLATLCVAACWGLSTATFVGCGDDDDDGDDSDRAGSGGTTGRAGGGGTTGRAGSGGTGGRAAGSGGSGGMAAGGMDAGGGTTVTVTIDEFRVNVVPSTAPEGEVTFDITNNGDFPHEIVVLKTDIAPRSLPIVDHEVNEDAPGIDVIDEIEDVLPGDTESLTVTLDAGKHVLVCNITVDLDDGGVLNHYVEGMSAAFLAE